MIKHPFYRGVFVWQDIEHEGKHEPIVSLELWQRANRTLDGHNRGALRTPKHSHPLKGTLYCRCGRAMSLTLAKGQHLYFFCLRRSDCSEPYVRVQDIGQQVEDLFDQITLPPETLNQLETKMSTALDNKEEHRNQMKRRLESRLEALNLERQKVLAAYYADAIPTDLLKQEQDRITDEQAIIETQLTMMNEHLAASDALVRLALDLAQDCGDAYRNANTEGKTLFVEAFFSRLTVSKGKIQKIRFEEPFDQILQSTLAEQPVRSQTLGGRQAERYRTRSSPFGAVKRLERINKIKGGAL